MFSCGLIINVLWFFFLAVTENVVLNILVMSVCTAHVFYSVYLEQPAGMRAMRIFNLCGNC